jgi:response regulator RpfG family c-di-GMP phosphodiesterase
VTGRPRILCVDDEPHILEGLRLHLHRTYDVSTATSADLALTMVVQGPPFAVVISDMRMPAMNGAELLAGLREMCPDTVRMLLTGQTDLPSAIAAVNEGKVFQFLSKPCPPTTLQRAVATAVAQHQLLRAERELLEETLLGSLNALTEVLALASPLAGGRAMRVKAKARELAAKLNVDQPWHVEVAAMLSQIGCVTLADGTLDRLHRGEELSGDEASMVKRLPEIAVKLLAHIPRLESVREAIAQQDARYSDDRGQRQADDLPMGARILKVVLDFDHLEAQGLSPTIAFDVMSSEERRGWYDPHVLEAARGLHQVSKPVHSVIDVSVHGLRPGMVLAKDVRMTSGGLLVAHGNKVTESLLFRLTNLHDRVQQPIRVVVPRPAAGAHAG